MRSQLGFLVLDVDLPVLPLAAVLVLYVEDVSGLETPQTLEFQGVPRQIRPQGLNHLGFSDQGAQGRDCLIVFQEGLVV